MAETRKISFLDLINKDCIQKKISSELDLQALSRLARTCKSLNMLFKEQLNKAQLVASLLQHVATDERDKAEILLKKNPRLLLLKGQVTDYCGRTFKKITAFQLALWALNEQIALMILKYLPLHEATQQLEEWESVGTSHGKYFDITGLTDILEKYIKNKNHSGYFIAFLSLQDIQSGVCWRTEVGGAQRELPLNLVSEIYGDRSQWFTRDNGNQRLGYDFAYARGIKQPNEFASGPTPYIAKQDLEAIIALCDGKMRKLAELKQQLLASSSPVKLRRRRGFVVSED